MNQKKQKESDIQKIIIDKLTEIASILVATQGNQIFFFAPLNETARMIMTMFGVKKDTAAIIVNFLKKMGLVPGVPDIIFCYCGKTIFIEVKKPGESPSTIQKIIHKKIRSTGHRVEIVFSLDDVLEILRFCGVDYE